MFLINRVFSRRLIPLAHPIHGSRKFSLVRETTFFDFFWSCSPLVSLLTNVFMFHLEEKLKSDGLMPHLYRRYDDDILARMPITDAVTVSYHPEWPTSSLTFTMERPVDDRIPFIRIEIIKNGKNLETKVNHYWLSLALV